MSVAYGSRPAAEKRDEIATLQLIELHSVPSSRGRTVGYRISEDQSADIQSGRLPHLDDDMPPDTETNDHHSSFVDRKGHPNIQEAGYWIALWSLSASKPLTFRTSDQITHQINMATPITGTNVTRTAPTTTYSSPIQNVRI
jgi:hypothetical protein